MAVEEHDDGMSVEEARRPIEEWLTHDTPGAVVESRYAARLLDRLILEVQDDVILKADAEDPTLGRTLRRILGRGAVLVEG